MAVWQIAAGDGTRDYSKIFMKFGVILVGPGDPGPYPQHRDIYNDSSSRWYNESVPRLADEIQIDELVILKRPHGREWEILAVGKIMSAYTYQAAFSDVDGWDLQHCRQVKWKAPKSQTILTGLRRGTLARVSPSNQNVLQNAGDIWQDGKKIECHGLPPVAPDLQVDELIDALIDHGTPSNHAELVTSTIWRLRRLAKWYDQRRSEVGEHEIRTFMIAPLITALGWAEQRIKIEWNKIDIALFCRPYEPGLLPSVIIESKSLGHGLRYADDQAQAYLKEYPDCKRLVVSDGIRYKLYKKDAQGWGFHSYLNLSSPRSRHPYFVDVKGAREFFLELVP